MKRGLVGMSREMKPVVEISSDQPRAAAVQLGTDLCRFRADEQVFARQQKALANYFVGAHGPVLDVACGRGLMLEILKSLSIESYGVDVYGPALEICRARGVAVVESDVFAHLEGLRDACLGGIFCSHFIEHLGPSDALRLLRECHRVLRPNGALVLVTPNSLDLLVLMQTFWMDLTHVRLYPGALLQPLLKEIGFGIAKYYDDKYTRYGGRWRQRVLDFIRHWWLWGLANRGDLIVAAQK